MHDFFSVPTADVILLLILFLSYIFSPVAPTATKLQAGWRGYSQKSKYQKLRTSGENFFSSIFTGIMQIVQVRLHWVGAQHIHRWFVYIYIMYLAAIAIQAWWRGILARRRAKRRREAANTVRRYQQMAQYTPNTEETSVRQHRGVLSCIISDISVTVVQLIFFSPSGRRIKILNLTICWVPNMLHTDPFNSGHE